MESVDFDNMNLPSDFRTSFAESASSGVLNLLGPLSDDEDDEDKEEKTPEDYFDEASEYCVQFLMNADTLLSDVEEKQKKAIMKEMDKVTDEKYLRKFDEVILDIGTLLAAAKKEKLALEFLDKGLPITSSYIMKSTYLEKIGEVYYHLGDENAKDYFEEALQIKKEMGRAQNEETLTLLSRLGYIYTKRKEFLKSMEVLQDSLDIVRYLGNLKREGSILNSIGFIYRKLGMNEQALVYYLHSIQIAREIQYAKGERTVLNVIGKIYFQQGRFKEALEAYEKLLGGEKRKKERVKILNVIGKIYSKQKRHEEAITCFTEILETKRLTGDRKGVGNTLGTIAQVWCDSGDLKKGMEFFTRSLEVKRQLGDKRGEGKTMNNIAVAYCELSMFEDALKYFKTAVQFFKDLGNKQDEIVNVNSIARIHFMQENHEEALEKFTRVLKLKMELENQDLSSTLIDIGSVFFYQKKNEKALEYFDQALTLAKEAGNPGNASLALNYKGKIFELQKKPEVALDSYQKSLRLQRGIEDRKGEIVNLNSMALVHFSMKNYEKALFCSEKALQISQDIGERWGEADAMYIIAETKWKLKSYSEAMKLIHESKRKFLNLKRTQDVQNCKVIEDDIKKRQISMESEMNVKIEKKIFRKKLADFIFFHEKHKDGVKCILQEFVEIPLVMTLIADYRKNSLFHGPTGGIRRRKVSAGEILPESRLPKHPNIASVLHHFVDTICEDTMNEDFYGMFGEVFVEVKCGFVVTRLHEETLKSYILDDQMGEPLSEFSVLLMMRGIMLGLKQLYDQKIVHRNLNPETIVMSTKRRPVITNFWNFYDASGNFSVANENWKMDEVEAFYLPPEVCSGDTTIDYSKTDVFSAGMIMYWMMTGGSHDAFPDDKEKTYENHVVFENTPNSNYSKELISLMENMIHCDIAKRLGTVECLMIVNKMLKSQEGEQKTMIRSGTRKRSNSLAKIIRPPGLKKVKEKDSGRSLPPSQSEENLKMQAELMKKKEEEAREAERERLRVEDLRRKKVVKSVGYLVYKKRSGDHDVVPFDQLEGDLEVKMGKKWAEEENENLSLWAWLSKEIKYFVVHAKGSEVGGESGTVGLTKVMAKRCRRKAKFDEKAKMKKENDGD